MAAASCGMMDTMDNMDMMDDSNARRRLVARSVT
jgi:hypothetical protein